MNRIHQKIWSPSRGAFVAVAETARTRSKRAGSGLSGCVAAGLLVVAGPLMAASPGAQTLPSGAQVVAGQVSLSSQASTLDVTQTSARAAVNWQSFDIGRSATVNFHQPDAQSIILNRVVGNERTVIDGALNANGQVWILNASGVLFNRSAQVDTAGLVASTLGIGDADFMAGRSTFQANAGSGSVVNFGTLHAADAGHVALLGHQVINEGVITARLGTAVLAAGDQISLTFEGRSHVGVRIDRGALDALVANRQAIVADGGEVVLTAHGLDQVMASVVNNTGEIRARTVASQQGHIYLLGDKRSDRIEVGGTLDASAPDGGDGGRIETSAARASFAPDVQITSRAAQGRDGTWVIDPYDFTVAATGGDITGAALGAALANGNVTIEALSGGVACTGATGCAGGTSTGNGDIFVNDSISKTAGGDATLTFKADRSISIGPAVSIGATAGRLGVHLSANNDATQTGSISIGDHGSITTHGGNIVIGSTLAAGQPGHARDVNVQLGAGSTLDAGAGNVNIYAGNLSLASDVHVSAANISAEVDSTSTGSSPGIKLAARDTVSVDATGTLQLSGTFSPPAGSAFITSDSQTMVSAGNAINLSGSNVYIDGMAFKLTGNGRNTLTLSALNNISMTQTSVAFTGTPDLNLNLQQGQTQGFVTNLDPNVGTLAAFLLAHDQTAYDMILQQGYVRFDGTHFGMKGAGFKVKVFNDTAAQTITPRSIDNGLLASGNGLEDSLTAMGTLKQPFYYDSVIDRWFKLTYYNYPLDMAFGVDGTSGAGWNNGGQILSTNGGTNLGAAMSNLSVDTSLLVGGKGRVTVSYDVTVPASLTPESFNVRNTYTLGDGDRFIKTLTAVTNTSATPIENMRLWLGTRDDWVAISDSNYKTKGNLGTDGFTPITDVNQQARTILISQFDPTGGTLPGSAILFHSTNTDAETVTDRCCSFSNIFNKDPHASSIVTPQQDGSYGIFMNFRAVAAGDARGVTWYYGAAPLSQVNALADQVVTRGNALAPDTGSAVPDPVTPTAPARSSGTSPGIAEALRNETPRSGTGEGTDRNEVPRSQRTSNVVQIVPGLSPELGRSGTDELLIVSSVHGDAPVDVVTLSQASHMVASADPAPGGSSPADGEREVRVPASRNSPVRIVNGGVRLPEGVDQQLFVTKK